MISPAVGSGQVNVSGTSYTWTGLTNGQEYQVQVRARNAAPDPSEWSGWSAGEIPAGVPDAPAAPRVQRVDSPVAAQITGSWEAPFANGDAVSQYEVTILREGAQFRQFTVPGSTTTFTEDAPAGSSYTATVRAMNKAGWGETSQASAPVRSFVKPSAPGTPSASANGKNGQVELAFSNAQPNGDPIKQYQVSVNGGGWQNLRTDRVVTGLNNGQSYTFRVRAMNTYAGDPSGASASAVPYGPLANPSMRASGNAKSATFSWNAPDGNGRDITAIQVRFTNDNGGWGGWQSVGASGNRTVGDAYSTTYRGEIQVTRSDGQVTRDSAQATSGKDPANPRVAVSRTRPAQYPDRCVHRSCAHLDMRYWDLPAGNYKVTFDTSMPRGTGPSISDSIHNKKVHTIRNGAGTLTTPMFFGYPGETITVLIEGPVTRKASLRWPDAPPG
ncbi:hypothetical protein GB881_08985 [Georgenia subflava]|uniref:Fibronectin type-III domain-containing protein n=2 Tax=Georgenia subflava TaxID=1622177 RepID=A0A6N7EKV7_9MICO|nr:hypothetical protein [Georgenia subflava]